MPDDVWERFETLSAREQLPYWEDFYRKLRVGSVNDPKDEKRTATRIYQKNFGGGYYGNERWGIPQSQYASNAAQERALANLRAEKERLSGPTTGLPPEEILRRYERIQQIDTLLATPIPDGGPNGYQERAYQMNAALDKDKNGVVGYSDLYAVIQHLPPIAVRERIDTAVNSGIRSARLPRQEATGSEIAQVDETTETWQSKGAEASSESRASQDRLAGTGFNSTTIGEQYTAAQRCEILQTKAAIGAMQKAPPLRLLVNPKSFSVKSEKIVSDGNWNRTGPIIEFWGDNQDKISASGQVAGFYAMDQLNATGPGLTRSARQFSAGYRNFLSLYQLYRNNGGVYLTPCGSTDKERNLSLLGSVYLYYDNVLYFGSFDSFSITEEDGKPFQLEYSWEFTVRAAFLLDRPSDPRIDYGVQGAGFVSESVTLPTNTAVTRSPFSDEGSGVLEERAEAEALDASNLSSTEGLPGFDADSNAALLSWSSASAVEREEALEFQTLKEEKLLELRREQAQTVFPHQSNASPPLGSLNERLQTFARQQKKFKAGAISFDTLQSWQIRLELTDEEIEAI